MSTTTTPNVYQIFLAVHQGCIGHLCQVLEKDGRTMKNLCECNEQKETPLQVAIRERNFQVIEYLVQLVKDHIQIDCHPYSRWVRRMSPYSWDKINVELFAIGPAEFGKEFTQTFVLPSTDVAILRDMADRIDIFKLIEYLIDVADDDTSWFEFFLNSMVASSMDRAQKIIALELMGSAFILKIRLDDEPFEPDEISGGLRGLQCWKKALELRNSTANGRRPMPKIPHVLSSAARNALGDSAEVTTSEQLQELEYQLRRHDRRSLITDQAFLVIQRTFAQRQLVEPNLFHLKTLLDYGKQFKTTGDHFSNTEIHYGRAINISLMIMQQFNRTDFPKCFQVFVEAFLLFFNVLTGLERKTANNAERIKELTFAHVLEAIRFGFMIATNLILLPSPICDQHTVWESLVMRKIYLLMVTLFKMPKLDPPEGERLCRFLGNFFRVEQLRNGFASLLHLAVEGFVSARIDVTVRAEIVTFFLDNGADPKSLNRSGRSPLHILALKCQPNSNELFFEVFQAVLEAGGHLDQATPDGKTAIALLQEMKKKHFQESLDPRVNHWINTVMSLECYCAQKIRQEHIAFEGDEQQLPLCLQQFIEQHSPLKGKLQEVERPPPIGFPSAYRVLQDFVNASHISV
ncbi:protein fem-1 homolog A-A-like [Daphnia pulex]|uniref:protein fem-1 homolog A-A-like n=1 Tax=Daphnia pulex TaxID=6669 RepID=UPI001EE01EB4|nr:protein fem-1 homolog A-A-like [Daphnia pulex]